MSEIQEQIKEANRKILGLEDERKTLEASVLEHEQQARRDRARMSEVKKEISDLRSVLGHATVVSETQKAAQAAKDLQAMAQKQLEETKKAKVLHEQEHAEAMGKLEEQRNALEKQKKELEALISRAKEATNKEETE